MMIDDMMIMKRLLVLNTKSTYTHTGGADVIYTQLLTHFILEVFTLSTSHAYVIYFKESLFK